MTITQDRPVTLPAQYAATVPAAVAALAATLAPCVCGALPDACRRDLTGLSQRACCASCDHYPELPRQVEGMTHAPGVCAAWADANGSPRGVACPDHWEADAVREYRAETLHRYYEEIGSRGRRGIHRTAELVPAHVLHRESHVA